MSETVSKEIYINHKTLFNNKQHRNRKELWKNILKMENEVK